MTNREFYTAIVDNTITDDVRQFAKDAIQKMDEKNAKRKGTLSANQKANEEIKAQILATMEAGTVYTAKMIADAHEIVTQKASALMRQLLAVGAVTETEVKEKGKTKVKGYTLVVND